MDDGWSPKLIAQMLARDHHDDRLLRVSHETIYKCLYVQTVAACAQIYTNAYPPSGQRVNRVAASTIGEVLTAAERNSRSATARPRSLIGPCQSLRFRPDFAPNIVPSGHAGLSRRPISACACRPPAASRPPHDRPMRDLSEHCSRCITRPPGSDMSPWRASARARRARLLPPIFIALQRDSHQIPTGSLRSGRRARPISCAKARLITARPDTPRSNKLQPTLNPRHTGSSTRRPTRPSRLNPRMLH